MPISHRIDETLGIVITTAEGATSAEDLRRHAEALASDPAVRGRNELVDLSNLPPVDVATDSVRSMADYLRTHDRNEPGGKLAIVAPSDVLFGLARLYEVHREHPAIQIRVFRKRDEALAWLGAPPAP